jgi:hypothetical protein
MTHFRGAEARYRMAIFETVSDELHLEGVAQQLCRQFDSWSGVWKKLVIYQTLRFKKSD